MDYDKIIKEPISLIRVVFEFYPSTGGSITHIIELSKKIDPYLESQLIIAPNFNSSYKDFDESFGIPIFRVDYPRWFERNNPFGLPVIQFILAGYALNTARIIKKMTKNNMVIDVHGTLLGAILAYVLNKIMRLNIPIVIHQHSANLLEIDRRSAYNAKLAFVIFRFSKPYCLIVVDDGMPINEYIKILNKIHINYEIVNHAVDVNLYKPTQKINYRDEFVVLSTQRLVPFKRVDLGILAMKKFLERHQSNRRSFKLILVGSGTETNKLKHLVDLEEMSDIVTFAGEQNKQEVIDYINMADVVIGTSLKSNLNLSIQEAMACGKPVVAFDAGRTNQLIRHMENGLLAKPGDPLDLAEKIEILYKNPNLREEIGKNARETIIKNKSWTVRIKKELDIYKNALSYKNHE